MGLGAQGLDTELTRGSSDITALARHLLAAQVKMENISDTTSHMLSVGMTPGRGVLMNCRVAEDHPGPK